MNIGREHDDEYGDEREYSYGEDPRSVDFERRYPHANRMKDIRNRRASYSKEEWERFIRFANAI